MSERYRGKRFLVVGLGKSGLAAAKYLLDCGAEVRANDRRLRKDLPAREVAEIVSRGAELILGSHPETILSRLEAVVLSPGVPLDLPMLKLARRRGLPFWGELELGFRELQGDLIAVTGTKGKSTTASLIAAMLEKAGRPVTLAGNIGTPLIETAVSSRPDQVTVVEASSFQLATADSFRPKVALLLDVSPDHLDWHSSFEEYLGAKMRLFANQTAEDWLVVFGGSALTVKMTEGAASRKLYFDTACRSGLLPHLHLEGDEVLRHEEGQREGVASLASLKLPGAHNRRNAMAAIAAAQLSGVPREAIESALGEFQGLENALQRVAEIDGVAFYNDSKATTIAAVKAALQSFDSGVLLIMGGRNKGGDYRELRELVREKVDLVLALGESRQMVADALKDVVKVLFTLDLPTAVRQAFLAAKGRGIVLLSPGGSSFDMFSDYRERGRAFVAEVERLKSEVSGG